MTSGPRIPFDFGNWVARLQQRDRVAIERNPKVCLFGQTEPLQEVSAESGQVGRVFGLHQQMPTPAILDAINGARRRPDDR